MIEKTGFSGESVATQAAPLIVDRRRLAAILGVSQRSIGNYRRMGLPCLKLGGRVLYDVAEVMTWLRGQQQPKGE
jgi:phage terminase Nu1 subunit (DNA packaging protein)